MTTSRNDGILVINTIKPYEMAIEGGIENDKHEIICREPTSKMENIVFEIEDMFISAAMDMAERSTGASKATKAQLKKDEKDEKDFYESDCPSEEQMKTQEMNHELLIRMAGKTSELMDKFSQLIAAGLVNAQGDLPMTAPRWESVSREDKKRIMFRYCAFFVRPLATLQSMA